MKCTVCSGMKCTAWVAMLRNNLYVVHRRLTFVADVKPNIEKSIADALSKKGITSYFPVQKTVALSGDNKAKVITTPISPGVLYIHCTEEQRKYILHLGLHILRFVGNGTGGPKIIADSDMDEYIHQLDIRNEA